ncbi:hypothetical protein [Rhizobium sp. MHM7A]|uniref:hypothetical protein n=1 Tax=Rhizobium sp. MHM7A TaxID=2583233 RepID=UPI0011066571|nr:hypothetical protein [Rhizobium sp. MHM7A]TLX17056.1 hypothetical protein FFR93_07000 [Rhizobium sp. MHM7A]
MLDIRSVIEEVPLDEIVFAERIKGVHEPYVGQPEGHLYILRDGYLVRIIPAIVAQKKVFFFDINHRFDAETVKQVWRIRPAAD